MSCRWCAHWQTPDGFRYDSDTGKCTRFPEPVTTHHAHFCGEIVLDNDTISGKSIIQHFYDAMHCFADEAREERDRRIELQKKCKELRKKLREKKQ